MERIVGTHAVRIATISHVTDITGDAFNVVQTGSMVNCVIKVKLIDFLFHSNMLTIVYIIEYQSFWDVQYCVRRLIFMQTYSAAL